MLTELTKGKVGVSRILIGPNTLLESRRIGFRFDLGRLPPSQIAPQA
jgi:hypothetical protein